MDIQDLNGKFEFVHFKNESQEFKAHNKDDKTSTSSDDKRDPREQWGGRFEFLLSCIGVCVGLGNVWRFPYLTYQNGGGAFLIPYFTMLVLCGIPLFKLELCFGQFAGQGPVTAWRAVPIFKGIGFGMMIVSFLICIYYNVIIGWSLFYLFASMQSVLPWTLCDQWWNKESYCPPENSSASNTTMSSRFMDATNTTISSRFMDTTNTTMSSRFMDATNTTNKTLHRRVSTSEDYWRHRVLRVDRSAGIHDPGMVLWDLCLCLLLSWIIVFLCLIKGVKTSGKVVYFTATFPYVLIFILLIRGVTLEGAGDGIYFYVTPVWSKLKESAVWSAAATQIFYSLGLSFGALLTFASYNKFHNNLLRDALIISIGNCATSVFAGFVIFSVIGHMAYRLDLKVEEVIDQGPGLAFIAYPEAVALLPAPQLWAVMFFFMLFTLGLDSQFGFVETIVTGIIDEFPIFFKGRKTWLTLFVCIVGFILGLLLVTEGGIYWLNMFDYYAAYYGLLLISLLMCLVLNWGYGFFFTYRWRFIKDVKLMLGFEPHWYFKATWMVISPLAIIFILVFSIKESKGLTYHNYDYPKWANDLGLCLSLSSIVAVPVYAIGRVIYALRKGEPLKSLIQPSKKWRPSDRKVQYNSSGGPIPYAPFDGPGSRRDSSAPSQESTDQLPNTDSKTNESL